MDGSEAYLNLCRDQLLNLNNLYLICYHNNLQMHNNFERFLNQRSTIPQHGLRFNFPESTPIWNSRNTSNNTERNYRASPTPPSLNIPNPPSLFSNHLNNNTPTWNGIFSINNRNNSTSNSTNNSTSNRFNTFQRRQTNRRRNLFNTNRNNFRTRWNFSSPFTRNTEEWVLNNSLYDSLPNNPLPSEDYLRETTNDTWHNTRLLLNLQENTRCTITQEEFNEDDIVTRIYNCNHVFNHDALLRWFQRDTRCPVCRYNLLNNSRTNVNNDISRNNTNPITWRVPLTSPLTANRNTENNSSENTTSENTTSENATSENATSENATSENASSENANHGNNSSVNDLFNTIADEIEQNITNTLMDNSSNLMNISTQVANSLLNAMGTSSTSPSTDFLTTEFSFNLQPNYTGFDSFNFTAPCTNQRVSNNNTSVDESKTETNLNEETKNNSENTDTNNVYNNSDRDNEGDNVD